MFFILLSHIYTMPNKKSMKEIRNAKVEQIKKMLVGAIIESVEPTKNNNGLRIRTRSFIRTGDYYKADVNVEYENDKGCINVTFTE